MTLDINIQHDLKKLQRDLTTLEKRAVPQASVRMLNRLSNSAKTASAKHIAGELGSHQAGVKRRITTRKATFKQLWSTLVAHGRGLQMIEFVVGSKRPTQQAGGKRGLVRTKIFLGSVKLISKHSLLLAVLVIARLRFMSARVRLALLFG